jgi:hypothetical protein
MADIRACATRRTRRVTAGAVSLGLVLIGMTALPAVPAVASAGTPASSATPAGNVIVVLRNQHTNLHLAKGNRASARIEANHASQAPLIAQARTGGASRVHGFSAINAFSARVTGPEAAKLAANPDVAAVVPDLPIKAAPVIAAPPRSSSGTVGPQPQAGPICPADPSKPLLEPEALQLTNTAFADPTTPQARSYVDGAGVKVAFIADGLDINNPDFIRPDGSHVFVDYQDFSGDGPAAPTGAAEAFGDASAIAAQGRQVYDLSNFVNPAHPLPAGCTIQIQGMAPGASLIGLKVFGNANSAPTSRFIQAIDYAVTDGADVLNESFGGNPFPDTSDDPITLADNAAIAAGVTVVASTGDAGTTGTVGSPASSPDGIISVAGTTSFQSYIQDTYAGAQLSNGTWISNNISGLSSGGVTQSGGVPDLAAPGDLGWALCTPDVALYTECTTDSGAPSPIQNFGGTSQSSPLTAGAAALVIEAYEKTHGGVRPSPALVKRFLTSTATDLGHPAYEQGAGLVNSLGAVQAAESWRDANGVPARTGSALVVDKTQLRLCGDPGNSVTSTVSVTNDGNTVQLVQASTRSFEDVVSTQDGTAPLNTATAPSYLDSFGIARSYVARTFTVGNVDRLDVSATAASAPAASRIILIDPTGAYAAYSIPQGAANYAHADVRFPKAGTWTMYIALSRSSGFNGTFAYRVVQTDFSTHGRVSPAYRTLRPGQTGSFTVRAQLPTSPQDLSASVQFTPSTGGPVSVPMTLRAIVPPRNTTFVGTITGGNGRQFLPAQSNFYRLQVPGGKRDLSIGFRFQDPNQVILATLTAPDGQVYSFQSNVPDGQNLQPALQIYRRDPQPGTWLLDLATTTPASGQFVSSQFVATVAYNTVDVRGNLPNGGALKAGVPVTVPVQVHNTGAETTTYYADARLTTVGTIPLAELSGHSTFPLPEPAGVTPIWLVPTETSELTATAAADQPVNLDIDYNSGNPERYAAANGNSATVDVNARMVSPGIWSANIGQTGPFAGPAPAGTVTVSATSTGRLFDPAVASDGGDPWQLGVAAPADTAAAAKADVAGRRLAAPSGSAAAAPTLTGPAAVSATPLTLRPGQSGTIMVTITPSGPSGSAVRGDLFIDSFDNFTDGGDELTDLPYRYRIK